ncbi:MAG: cytochrome C oxidase subunit IV family protein [Rudaea sp.]|uniref:cytochrome C oxidase subunit IV family protein n=1 Tax=Rudaea sp. TaxID=2136325 RepID=UPI0039E6D610
MNASLRAAHVAFALLVAATLASTWAAEHEAGGRAMVALVLLLAGFKARLVVLEFMELRHAPLPWRIAFETWIAAVVAMIFLFCLLS